VQCEDALKDEDMGGVDGVFVRKPGVLLERVDWNVNLLPRFDVPEMLHQQVKIDSRWSIEVVFISESGFGLFRGEWFVV